MEDILELGSFHSLSGSPSGRGREGGLAGVSHRRKCLVRLIHNTWGCKEHLEISFAPFAFQLT